MEEEVLSSRVGKRRLKEGEEIRAERKTRNVWKEKKKILKAIIREKIESYAKF